MSLKNGLKNPKTLRKSYENLQAQDTISKNADFS